MGCVAGPQGVAVRVQRSKLEGDPMSSSLFGMYSMSRRRMLGLTAAAATSFSWRRLHAAAPGQPDPKTNETIKIGSQAGVVVTFERRGLLLSLLQIQRQAQPPMLYSDTAMRTAG